MLFRQGTKARVLWRWASGALLVFFLSAIVARFSPPAWDDTLDAVRGFFLGAAIGIFALALIVSRREPHARG